MSKRKDYYIEGSWGYEEMKEVKTALNRAGYQTTFGANYILVASVAETLEEMQSRIDSVTSRLGAKRGKCFYDSVEDDSMHIK